MSAGAASCTVAEYLAIRLRDIGVKHIFTVPGDYCAPFLEVIDNLPGIERVPNINELGSGYAADGYARFRGAGAACVQYGVGSFSLLNAVAGSYVEFVPVAIVSSSPNAADRLLEGKQNILFHHSTGDLRADQRVFENVTVASVVITSACGAPEAIDGALTEMLTARRPVYIEVIHSAWTLRCPAPSGELKARSCASDPAALMQAVAAARDAIAAAQRPVFFFGIELQRFGIQEYAQRLVDATGIPFTTTSLAKTVLDEAQPLFAGTYAGPASVPYTNDLVTSSDCVIALGTIITDDYLALMAPSFSTMIRVSHGETRVGITYFPSVTLADFLAALLAAIEAQPPAKRAAPAIPDPRAGGAAGDDAAITFERFYEAVGAFVLRKEVRDRYILILGESTSLYVFGNLFGLPAESFVAQAAWGSLGHETGSALGVALATGKRPLVVAGDGGFMMICQEISSLVRAGANAAVFVMSNRGYAIEQAFVDLNAFKPGGEFAPFDVLPEWDYGALAKAFGARGVRVERMKDLRHFLEELPGLDGPTLVEVVVPEHDLAPQLARLAGAPPDTVKYRRGERAKLRSV
jgi:indolepyruvate decarboxylase